ncbi:hypothetical protein GCWU000341_01430 [Oribacterium sp. oral taxon 078 str. F0262]|nr:hypothetical protein GCWU000341_01430 [Oribacterium sp. oral taxon 078 str. F0262]
MARRQRLEKTDFLRPPLCGLFSCFIVEYGFPRLFCGGIRSPFERPGLSFGILYPGPGNPEEKGGEPSRENFDLRKERRDLGRRSLY